MGLTGFAAATVGYHVFLTIVTLMIAVTQRILEYNLVEDGAISFHKRTNHTTVNIYEQDALRLLDNLPALLPLTIGILFLDPTSSKFAFRLPLMGLLLTSIICLLPQTGGSGTAAYYVASVTHGLCGGVYLAMLAALSYTATSDEAGCLCLRYGRMMSTVYFGQAIGRQIAFHLMLHIKPILITICVTCALILIISFVWNGEQKQQLPVSKSASTSSTTTTPDPAWRLQLLAPLHHYTNQELHHILVLLACTAVYQGCQMSGVVATEIFITDPSKLHWSSERVHIFECSVLICQGIASILLLPILVKAFYVSELTLLMICIAARVLSLAVTGFSTETWMVYLTIPLDSVSGLAITCCLTIITQLSNSQDIGKIFSFMMIGWVVSECVGALVSTVIALELYNVFHGSAFIILAICMMILFGCVLWVSVNIQTYQHQTLLKDVKVSDEVGSTSNLEIEAEQWLLNAYENAACTSDETAPYEQEPLSLEMDKSRSLA